MRLAGTWGLTSCRLRVRSPFFGQWAAANCAAPPTASASQYATSHCEPLLSGFPRKWRYINVGDFLKSQI